MKQPRIPLTPAKMKRLFALLDDARTMERLTSEIENRANALLGGGEMDAVLEYTVNNTALPIGAWCERTGVGYTIRRTKLRRHRSGDAK